MMVSSSISDWVGLTSTLVKRSISVKSSESKDPWGWSNTEILLYPERQMKVGSGCSSRPPYILSWGYLSSAVQKGRVRVQFWAREIQDLRPEMPATSCSAQTPGQAAGLRTGL